MRNNRSKNAVGVDIMTNFALIDGKKIAYDDLGEGTPVIFIHPPGMGRKVFYFPRFIWSWRKFTNKCKRSVN
jgi:pimeloyl-ACP methyl ester carboxylesterase